MPYGRKSSNPLSLGRSTEGKEEALMQALVGLGLIFEQHVFEQYTYCLVWIFNIPPNLPPGLAVAHKKARHWAGLGLRRGERGTRRGNAVVP